MYTINAFKNELRDLLKKYNAEIYCDLDGDTHGVSSSVVIDIIKDVEAIRSSSSISHHDIVTDNVHASTGQVKMLLGCGTDYSVTGTKEDIDFLQKILFELRYEKPYEQYLAEQKENNLNEVEPEHGDTK